MTLISSAGLACVERGLDTPGNDGFIGGRDAIRRRLAHPHDARRLDEEGGKDPAFYVLDSLCDVRKCDFGIDYCRAEEHEHFTFVARNDGIHYLGIDDRNEGGGRYGSARPASSAATARPQHGKACDATNPNDMNKDSATTSAGSSLRPVDSNQTFESGVHDDFTVANVIEFPGEGAPIVDMGGTIGGCTADYYTFTVQQGPRA